MADRKTLFERKPCRSEPCYDETVMEVEVRRRFEYIESVLVSVAERQSDAEARADRADARMDRFDRQLHGMRKLVMTGMKMLVRIESTMSKLGEEQREVAKAQRELAVSQRVTDKKLQAFIDSLRRGGNGRRR